MNKKAILYGASNYDAKFVLLAAENQYEIIAATDDNENYHGRLFGNKYEIQPLSEALKRDFDVVILTEAVNEAAAGSRIAAARAGLLQAEVAEDKIIPAYLLQRPKVICFGSGKAAEHFLSDIEKRFDVIGFADNNTHKYGGKIKGKSNKYEIMNFYDAMRADFDYIIITSVNFTESIARQLEAWGIPQEKIKAPFFAMNRTVDIRDIYFSEDSYSGYPILIAIDTLAIENYYGKNDFGMAIHEKHWDTIGARRDGVAYHDFISLIKSVEKGGYDFNSKILLTRSNHLSNGAHRAALAIYHGNYALGAEILAFNYLKIADPKNTEWLVKSCFTDFEIKAILAKEKEIRQKINTGFSFIIWGEFFDKAEAIERDLSYFGETTRFKDLSFDCYDDFAGFCRLFYLSDDTFVTRMPEGAFFIEKKLDELREHPLKIRILKLAVPDYDFAADLYGFPLSQKMLSIKLALRSKYQNVETGTSVIHAFDSFAQSAYFEELALLFEKKIDISPFLEEIKNIPYAIASDVGEGTKFPGFPYLSPKKEDVDLFCPEESADKIAEAAEKLFKQYENGTSLKTVAIREAGERHVKLMFNNMSAAHIHIQTKYGEMTEDAVRDICKNRTQLPEGGYIPDAKRMFLIHMARYRAANYKYHHFAYCEKNIEDFDAELMKKYFDPARFSIILEKLGIDFRVVMK